MPEPRRVHRRSDCTRRRRDSAYGRAPNGIECRRRGFRRRGRPHPSADRAGARSPSTKVVHDAVRHTAPWLRRFQDAVRGGVGPMGSEVCGWRCRCGHRPSGNSVAFVARLASGTARAGDRTSGPPYAGAAARPVPSRGGLAGGVAAPAHQSSRAVRRRALRRLSHAHRAQPLPECGSSSRLACPRDAVLPGSSHAIRSRCAQAPQHSRIHRCRPG